MQKMINDLLTYSRVATKVQPPTQVDLEEIVSDVLSDLEVRIEQTGGRVEVGPLPTLYADPTHMRQLFQNLIGNALKFHAPGVAPLVQIDIATESDGNLCITVRDNGIGFEQDYADRIFQPFQRLHGRDTYEGNGIGLAICRKIVEQRGGQIYAESSPGKGTCFTIIFPPMNADEQGEHNHG